MNVDSEFTPLEGPRQKRRFLVLDIESKAGQTQKRGFTRPFMVGVYDGERYTPFFDTTSGGDWRERYFWEGGCVDRAMRHILTRKYRGRHIYAHNAGRFDYLFLLPWLMMFGRRLGFMFSVIPVASSIQVLDVWRTSEMPDELSARRSFVWRFLDSYKLIPTALDKAAKAFETHRLTSLLDVSAPRGRAVLPEGKLEINLDLPEHDSQWVDYNRVDCWQLYAVLQQFHHYIEDVLLGDVGVTAPATSMRLYRRRYLKRSVPRAQDSHDFIRAGYYGGRVEVFRRDGHGLRYYDINSSYPAAMLEAMPASQSFWCDGKPGARFSRDGYVGFVECDVEVPETLNLPPLPVRAMPGMGPAAGKLIFPVGRLRGIWEWEELKLALEVGCTVVKWHRSVWYQGKHLFKSYVEDLYPYRDPNLKGYDPAMAQIVKIMLNALYGKFATKTIRKNIYLRDDPNLPDNAVPASSEPDSLVWYADEEFDAGYIMPQISARITALARIRLYRAMQEVERRGGTVYYCDTDSVITDVELPTSAALGALKDEYPSVSGRLSGHFLGPKLYVVTADDAKFQQIKAKGLQQRTRENFDALAAGKTIWMDRLEKIGTLARKGFLHGPQMLRVPRRILPDAGKRLMFSDGTTKPYVVRMW